jgi:DNA-binding CsgD family transcriptional regulator
MYREWNRPHGLTDSFCITLFRKPDHTTCLNLVLSEERRPVTDEDRQMVGLLVPHIRRAAMIGTEMELAQKEVETFQGVTRHMVNGLLIVDQNMNILYANPSAEQMLADGEIVESKRGRLVVTNATASARIERDVKLSAMLEQQLDGASFSIPMGDSFNPSIAHVIPLARRDPGQRFSRTAAAAIVIAGGQQQGSSSIDAFSDLFGLTAAEKRVAQLTAQGLPRASIADLSGVKESTVKSHLESIFSKTGTSGQTALTILIRTLSPPFGG